jgi:hypothetical protein
LLVPALTVLAAGAIAMGAYNARLTGHWWELPYLHYESLYTERPLLAFQHDYRTHEFRHEEMRKLHAIVDPQSPREIAKAERRWFLSWWRLETSRELFLGRTLVLPFFLGVVACLSNRRQHLVAAMLAGALVTMALLRYYKPHYLAPATVALYAAVAIGMQKLASIRLGRRTGVPLGGPADMPTGVRWGAALAAALVTGACASIVLKAGRGRIMDETTGLAEFADRRAAVVAELEKRPGKDVVFVRYGPNHNPHREWVYNRADIDAADIVWARDMGERANAALVAYFAKRHAWRLDDGFDDERDGLFAYDSGVATPSG